MGQFSSEGVRNWLGIRYGATPNGTLRFRPPQRAAVVPRNTVYNATSYSPGCPQNRGVNYLGFKLLTGFTDGEDGEDCLSLNIWSPSVDRLNSSSNATYAGTAVLVWIYGGAFQFGTSNVSYYNGNNFVQNNEDLTVVTLNYRTNIFGFPGGTSALSPYQLNVGLADQRLAIEWVYANIAQFGGDPERITLFGESAGASSVGAYPYAYQYDPIVKGLIMQSGSEYLMATEVASNETLNALSWNTIANQTGCGIGSNSSVTTPAKQLSCLQTVDWRLLQSATSNYTASTAAFAPKRDNNTVFDASQYTALSASGQFARLPVLIGNNLNEGSLLVALSPGISPDLITKFGFQCPAGSVSAARQNYSIPSWQYLYLGKFPNLNPPELASYGVYHSSEIPMVFGTYNVSTVNATASQAEIDASRAIQGGWAAFARNPASGLTQYGWPQYQFNGTSLIQLAPNGTAQVTYNSSQAYNMGCNLSPVT